MGGEKTEKKVNVGRGGDHKIYYFCEKTRKKTSELAKEGGRERGEIWRGRGDSQSMITTRYLFKGRKLILTLSFASIFAPR